METEEKPTYNFLGEYKAKLENKLEKRFQRLGANKMQANKSIFKASCFIHHCQRGAYAWYIKI